MSTLPELIQELGQKVGASSPAIRARVLLDLADLLVACGERLPAGMDALFDQAMIGSAHDAPLDARASAAERLGGAAQAPRGILRLLALDDAIVVAHPVLVRSLGLDDQDLMLAATTKSAAHRLAICLRERLTEMVTDVLLASAEREIGLALAGNAGARLSALGAATLIQRARGDEAMQDLMGTRTDLAPHLATTLLAIVRDELRARLEASLALQHAPASPRPAAVPPPSRPGEADLRDLAARGRTGEVERLFATLSGVTRALANRLLTERQNDLLLVVCRAKGWSWTTVRSLLALRDPALTERHQFRRDESVFDSVAAPTAERVLRFLAQSGPAAQMRSIVR